MDEITIERRYVFRSRIPFALYHRSWVCMDLKIEKPPMRRGKGENSWDLDDDGSFGMSAAYENGPEVSYKNEEAVFAFCCEYYCRSTHKDIKRYGRAADDKAPRDEFGFKYIGRVPRDNSETVAGAAIAAQAIAAQQARDAAQQPIQ